MGPPLNTTALAYPFLTLSLVLTQVTACLVTRTWNSWKFTCKESWLKRRTRWYYEKEHSQLEYWVLSKSYSVLFFKAPWVLVSCIFLGLHQCSCLENPRDGGAWWAAVHGVTQSRTRLKRLSSSSSSQKYSVLASNYSNSPPPPVDILKLFCFNYFFH